MNYKNLLFYNNNKFFKIKLIDKKFIGESLFLIYKNKHKLINSSLIIELPLKNGSKLYQLTYDVEEFSDHCKNNIRYFEQKYKYNECNIILRFNLKIELVEIVIEIFYKEYLPIF